MESQRDAKIRNAFEEVSEAAYGRINRCNSTNNESSQDTHSKAGKKSLGVNNKNTKNNDKNNNKNINNNDTNKNKNNHETHSIYEVDHSKGRTAKCKECCKVIGKNDLRIGKSVPFKSMHILIYFHVNCAFISFTPSSTRSFSFVHYTWRNGKY